MCPAPPLKLDTFCLTISDIKKTEFLWEGIFVLLLCEERQYIMETGEGNAILKK